MKRTLKCWGAVTLVGVTWAAVAPMADAQMARGGMSGGVGLTTGLGGVGGTGMLANNSLFGNGLANAGLGAGGLGYYYQPPYYGGINYDTLGGYIRGGAEAIHAQGNFLIQNQQSMMIRENVKQARIDTRRRSFDEYLYEREHTPTPEQERQRDRREQILRSLNDPPAPEILSGKALNDLLGAIQELQAKNVNGSAVTISTDLLDSINTTSLRSGNGNAGMLKARGKLVWPTAVRDLAPAEETADQIRQFDGMFQEASQQARNGQVANNLIRDMNAILSRLNDKLTRTVGDVTFGPYADAKRFLRNVDDAVVLLQQPDAGDYLPGGKNAVRAGNVQEFVRGMSERGLRFAPAVTGDEKAYAALHRGLVAYYNSLTQEPAKDK